MSGGGAGGVLNITAMQMAAMAAQQAQALYGGHGYGPGQAAAQIYGHSYYTPGFPYYRAPPAPTQAELDALAEARAAAVRAIPDEGVRPGEVIAWRVWRVIETLAGWRLKSLSMDSIWEPGTPMLGDPEGNGLVSGVYAVKAAGYAEQLAEINPFQPMVAIGEVALWGKIVEHELGYRAESAAVQSLTLRVDWPRFTQERPVDELPWPARLFRKRREKHREMVWCDSFEAIRAEIAASYGVQCRAEQSAGRYRWIRP